MQKYYLFHMTWPIFVELFLQMLVGNVDQMMVGWVSPSGVGAIGNANQIINILIILFSVISMAATILTTQSIGAKDYHQVSTIYTLSLVVNVLFALVISVILYLGAPTIFTWMQVPAELMEETVVYIRIIGSGFILQSVLLTFSAIFKSNRLMMESMVVAVVMNAANILGNYILIGCVLTGDPLGVAGAAISSNIAKAIGMVLIIWLFQKKIKPGLSFKSLHPFPTQVLRQLLYIGLPSGGEMLSYNLSQAVTMGFVNLCGGATIITRVYATMFAMISYLYSNAMSQASQVLVGYAIGARDYDQANRRGWRTTLFGVVISFSIAAFLFLFSDTIFGFFTDDPAVIALGCQILFIDMFLEVGRAIN
ncbi:MATE family efflux transporter, partial [Eubacterium aggregans]|uniref:MATE family efflux transporter n=1 Tax=Eubacterium aggregans TaxID=81409 RepID=UPI003F31F292